jgi:hypothetical protein
MDASKLTQMRRQVATVYLSRGQPQDSSMITRNNKFIAAAAGFVAPLSASNIQPAPCTNCPAVPNPPSIAASDYGKSRLDTSSQASQGNYNEISYDSVMFRRAGAAICCNNTPATTPPQGIYWSTCNCVSYPPSSTYTPPCKPGYNQTPHFAEPPCCGPAPSTLLSWPVQPC